MHKVKIIEDNFNKNLFDSRAVHPLQSWAWGEARKKTGVRVLRFGEFDGTELCHSFQMTIHLLPFGLRIGYIPRSANLSKDVVHFLLDFGKKEGLIFVKLEPYVLKNDPQHRIDKESKVYPSPHPLFPSWTQELDLTKTEDDLLKQMKPKTRYNIRLAQKKGIAIKEMSNKEGFEVFQKLYFATCKRQKYFGHNYHYHKIVWDSLSNDIAHILIAYFKDIPLAAYELFYFNGVFYYPYGGTSPLYRNFMAANLLMWRTILLGKKLGAKKFDMWGSMPPVYSEKHSWAGFTRFKEGYGTKFVEMVGSFDLVISPFLYHLYNAAHTIRELYLSFRK
ncbi:hypothetical protein A2334_02280 [Candidatus Roizmanbacteria bacterium RIFOXYB2_FULL_38_10]|uniref:BioF2-like acetyltransferase domain-containing protein n=1 Tax=Candidatus Roizmanbacteria bacterium RIFOXYD1_FULL_38_12 TaxID=1802093 RepID=A0A1F7L070_9BACT|nr:MAG: hypothetical protein A3K47_01690 [Candidatus Roizmanbacteria bacterium RIFOXYA2_FULL_38_14]OGK63495.1 MAG: hypothetical protein A3K27_01690 [Candidatus Roizmanbacteria bacterium RIFOXYA1_FULL_37_12]OGK65341.1 MAG: hypothetical protein A3K38_01690 [Candidatus Roizmanbacteria bacterium RIFOXYB1_FULL_40_23]OGK67945.1 MAG: hypothetical protein A2334_02280 [Candidatus Roizmanbacteria bacterium RIFOXYB2_FULL_38_10]OGK69746.1 MAG: hypothetical protein A3K21_01695 [Candidatus Roizmanbacteria ba